MSSEEEQRKKEEQKPSVDFSDVDYFLEDGEKDIKEKEEQVEEEIKDEEEKLDVLEETQEDIEEKKKEIDEKIKEEKAAIIELKKEEKFLHKAEKDTKELKKDIKEKRNIAQEAVKKIKAIFKKEENSEKKPIYREIYEDHYKKLLIIPFLMLVLAMGQIAYQWNTTGDFINRGVELKGGVTLTIPEAIYDIDELEQILSAELAVDITVRKMSQSKGVLIEASDVEPDVLLKSVEEKLAKELTEEEYSIEQMGSSLGSSFFAEIIKAILIAFFLMGIVVFITFRVPAPSLAVILAAVSDMIVTLAIFNMTGAKLGKGGIAAFLMLIGYSVDTDILLSTKVIKGKVGSVMDRVYSAMKTGLTMNITTMVALTVAIIFTQSDIIRQIMTILLIGLFVDIINTWIQNVGILRIYMSKKGKR